MIRTYRKDPPIVATPLELGQQSWFAVIKPAQRTNLVSNPSLETNTTGWNVVGGSALSRTATQQYHGAYSLQVVTGAGSLDGCYYDGVSLTSGTLYAYSTKFLGVANRTYQFAVYSSGGSELAKTTFRATGRWQWIYGYYQAASTATHRLYFLKDSRLGAETVYIDGVQVEALADASETVSTYIDGSLQGLLPNQSPPAYYWNGTPHASTSTRSGLTRAGGEVIPFSYFGVTLLSIVGLGLVTPFNAATEYARIDGGYPDYTRKPSRQFTLVSRFSAQSPAQLDYDRAGLSDLLDRDASALDQELVLRYQRLNERDQPISDAALLRVKYQSGLEGNVDNLHAEQVPITFTQNLPLIVAEGSAGAALSPQATVANADYFITRAPDGTWEMLGASGANGVVRAIAVGPNGDVYAGGDFTDFGGSGADYIARWNGSSWNTVGGATALNNSVYTLAFGPSGILYVGGAFTNAGGNANADRIATWDGSNWGALSTGADSTVLALAVTSTGNLYAAGQFGNIGTSTADNIAYWNGTTWANLAADAAINNNVYALAIGPGDVLYVGGDFTDANGIANADRIASWNGTVWAALSTGSASAVRALAVDANGWLYAGGGFTSIGGVTASHIARWNGVSWQPLGSGITTDVYVLQFIGQQLYAGGTIATAGGISVPDGLAIWTNGAWVYTDVDLPGAATVYALAAGIDGTLYVGYDQAGNATAASTTTITNPGSARSYPVITVKGPSSGTARLYSIRNTTTGRGLFFNLTVNSGETVTMVLTPDALSFTSDVFGSVASSVLPGSNTADWFLQKGDNVITLLSNSSSVTVVIAWQPAYTRLDGLTT